METQYLVYPVEIYSERIMRHADYRTTQQHYTVLGIEDDLKAISKLPAKQSGAIAMRYLEQEDYQTISDKLGCSKAGARSHVSKALAVLKDKMAALA